VNDIRTIEDADELARVAELHDVTFYEISAKRREGRVPGSDPSGTATSSTRVLSASDETTVTVRFRTTMEAPDASYVIDIGIVFRTNVTVDVADAAMRRFTEYVALPIAHPFVREAVHEIAAKLRLKRPVLPLLPMTGTDSHR
jgi:hypothetical protein